MTVAMAIMLAAISPLSSVSDYVFAPLPTNAVGYIKGEITGSGGDVKALRLEDFAYIEEAINERRALISGIVMPSTLSNAFTTLLHSGSMRFGFEPISFSHYILDEYIDTKNKSWQTGIYFPPLGEPVNLDYWTTATDRSRRETNVDISVSWQNLSTNAFRPDWPSAMVAVTNATTNISFYTYATNIQTTSSRGLRDCVLMSSAGKYLVPTSMYDGVEFSLGAFPTISSVTNIFAHLESDHIALTSPRGGYQFAEPVGYYSRTDWDYGDSGSGHYISGTNTGWNIRTVSWRGFNQRENYYGELLHLVSITEPYFTPNETALFVTGCMTNNLAVKGGLPMITEPMMVYVLYGVTYHADVDDDSVTLSTNAVRRYAATLQRSVSGDRHVALRVDNLDLYGTLSAILTLAGVAFPDGGALGTYSPTSPGDEWGKVTGAIVDASISIEEAVLVYGCNFRTQRGE